MGRLIQEKKIFAFSWPKNLFYEKDMALQLIYDIFWPVSGSVAECLWESSRVIQTEPHVLAFLKWSCKGWCISEKWQKFCWSLLRMSSSCNRHWTTVEGMTSICVGLLSAPARTDAISQINAESSFCSTWGESVRANVCKKQVENKKEQSLPVLCWIAPKCSESAWRAAQTTNCPPVYALIYITFYYCWDQCVSHAKTVAKTKKHLSAESLPALSWLQAP